MLKRGRYCRKQEKERGREGEKLERVGGRKKRCSEAEREIWDRECEGVEEGSREVRKWNKLEVDMERSIGKIEWLRSVEWQVKFFAWLSFSSLFHCLLPPTSRIEGHRFSRLHRLDLNPLGGENETSLKSRFINCCFLSAKSVLRKTANHCFTIVPDWILDFQKFTGVFCDCQTTLCFFRLDRWSLCQLQFEPLKHQDYVTRRSLPSPITINMSRITLHAN